MYYNYFKLIHILAVILFLGNIITGVFWMHIAVKTKDLKIINHTIKGIIASDRYFTVPGVFFIILGGVMTAINGRVPILQTGWILWSLILFSIAGIAFMVKLAPLQKKIYNLTLRNPETLQNDFDWLMFEKLYFAWNLWGLIALLTPLGALAMMVLKIPQ
jgi:uncharacterized membrane protein